MFTGTLTLRVRVADAVLVTGVVDALTDVVREAEKECDSVRDADNVLVSVRDADNVFVSVREAENDLLTVTDAENDFVAARLRLTVRDDEYVAVTDRLTDRLSVADLDVNADTVAVREPELDGDTLLALTVRDTDLLALTVRDVVFVTLAVNDTVRDDDDDTGPNVDTQPPEPTFCQFCWIRKCRLPS